MIPLQYLNLGGFESLLYLIKMMRMATGFKLFRIRKMIQTIELKNRKNILHIIETDEELANNMVLDNNNITSMVMINFTLKIIKLVIVIMNISYFLGFFWYIYCDL